MRIPGSLSLALLVLAVGHGAAVTGVVRQARPPAARFSIRAPGLTLELSDDGRIAGVLLGPKRARYLLGGETTLPGCQLEGSVTSRKLPGGGIEFTRKLANTAHRGRCTLVERFMPTKSSIRWEMRILGDGAPWSTVISTRLRWPDAGSARFWTAWPNSEQTGDRWLDPTVPAPFAELDMSYGAGQRYFVMPIATILDERRDLGLSTVLSVEDDILTLSLVTSKEGSVVFNRSNYRISKERPIDLALDLVPHKADIRDGLAWMVGRYPEFFDPPNPKAHEMAGCGAYSAYEGDLDAAKLRKMAFRINWKASFDFPYMGMFLPPVPGDDDRWQRFDSDSAGNIIPGKKTYTSRKQMNDYSNKMRDYGFYVLNYFNVTEFGALMGGPEQVNQSLNEQDLWKDATSFLYRKIVDGILYDDQGGRYGTWGGAVAMDPGGPNYQRFLLEMARRHLEKLTYSSGFCIDRTDWLSFYNPAADDGVSWHNGKPARATSMSWKGFMEMLGPMVHSAGKVIFINCLLARPDLMREVDGVYCEFGGSLRDFNTSALLGLRKPVLEWTPDEGYLRQDGGLFFQRHLYMGVFPTAPLPGNDHTINPSEFADKWYLDYGPMLDALRSRKWVLVPHVVEVTGGAAKANIFEVPGGYAVPVVLGGKAEQVEVKLQNLKDLTAKSANLVCEVLHPGVETWSPVESLVRDGRLTLRVPLVRGCAMVQIRTAGIQAARRSGGGRGGPEGAGIGRLER